MIYLTEVPIPYFAILYTEGEPMIITKYEHACLTVEESGQKLVIDPGIFSTSLPTNLTNVQAIIITHVHPDHIDETMVKQLITANPEVKIFSTQEVADNFQGLRITVVNPGNTYKAGDFTLAFFGGQHASIHPSMPLAQNIGVLVNATLFYPGDSFTLPGRPIQLLAVPISAPWLKISETIDYISNVKPASVIPTHDFILSTAGQQIHDRLVSAAADKISAPYTRLEPGKSITI
jgi:L-ascorbate metabolism protein UlaG (beta-lactamase superfamily)